MPPWVLWKLPILFKMHFNSLFDGLGSLWALQVLITANVTGPHCVVVLAFFRCFCLFDHHSVVFSFADVDFCSDVRRRLPCHESSPPRHIVCICTLLCSHMYSTARSLFSYARIMSDPATSSSAIDTPVGDWAWACVGASSACVRLSESFLSLLCVSCCLLGE